MIVLIDNYDSFVHNLARYLSRLGQSVRVERNDGPTVCEVVAMRPSAIVLSPGPCGPHEAGICIPLVHAAAAANIPLLGVCLGHQAIGAAFGLEVTRARPCHGAASWITHDGRDEFQGMPNPMQVGRYHSLIVKEPGPTHVLEATAFSNDRLVMALRHKTARCHGWQFHPESILTVQGYDLLKRFLCLADIPFEDEANLDEGHRVVLDPPAGSGEMDAHLSVATTCCFPAVLGKRRTEPAAPAPIDPQAAKTSDAQFRANT